MKLQFIDLPACLVLTLWFALHSVAFGDQTATLSRNIVLVETFAPGEPEPPAPAPSAPAPATPAPPAVAPAPAPVAPAVPAPTAKKPTARIVMILVNPDKDEQDKDKQGKVNQNKDKRSAGLGDEIAVTVEGHEPAHFAGKTWILYLNGVPLPGITPDNRDFANGQFRFYLRRDGGDENAKDATNQAWSTLLRGWHWKRSVSVALGTKDGVDESIEPFEDDFYLTVIPQNWKTWVSAILAIGIAVAITWLGQSSRLLRDRLDVPLPEGKCPPYSLAKVQWAWWIVLILYAYIAIGLVTWDYYNVFSTSALALLGISTGTAIGAGVINGSQPVRPEVKSLKDDVAALTLNRAAEPDPAARQAVTNEIKVKNDALTVYAKESRGFINDILSDDDGVSLHRFQIVVWTIVLGFVFVLGVWNEKTMPDFDASLLALMGISSGAYLAFKVPESRRPS